MKYILIYFGINLITVLYPIYLILRDRNLLNKNPNFYYENREWGKKSYRKLHREYHSYDIRRNFHGFYNLLWSCSFFSRDCARIYNRQNYITNRWLVRGINL